MKKYCKYLSLVLVLVILGAGCKYNVPKYTLYPLDKSLLDIAEQKKISGFGLNITSGSGMADMVVVYKVGQEEPMILKKTNGKTVVARWTDAVKSTMNGTVASIILGGFLNHGLRKSADNSVFNSTQIN